MAALRSFPTREQDGSSTSDDEEEIASVEVASREVMSHEQTEILDLQAELARAKAEEEDAMERLDQYTVFATGRQTRLEEQLAEGLERVKGLESEIDYQVTSSLDIPPGPACLYWVKSDAFKLVAMLVILINVFELCKEVVFGRGDYWLSIWGNIFLGFYVVELMLNILLWRQKFFIGPCRKIFWNWLDIIIVSTGIVDSFILEPIRQRDEDHHFHDRSNPIMFLRALRLLRLARVCKIVKAFFTSDLAWVNGFGFQTFIMVAIGFNAILLGFEDMFPREPQKSVSLVLNQMLQTIFTFELICRLKLAGCKFFYKHHDLAWNYVDTIIVVGGIIDLWILWPMSAFGDLFGGAGHVGESAFNVTTARRLGVPRRGKGSTLNNIDPDDIPTHSGSSAVMLLRLVRLLRVARVVRLIRSIPPLYTLIKGIASSMAGMGWVLVLTLTALYIVSLFFFKLAKLGAIQREGAADGFPNLEVTFFNFFMMMNGDIGSMEVVLELDPWFRWCVMGYMMVTNWTMFSILTAVVSDNMAAVTTSYQEEQENAQKEAKMAQMRTFLMQIFDKDITEKQFEASFTDDSLREQLEKISDHSFDELVSIFKLIAHSGDTAISVEAFSDYATNDLTLMRVTKLVLDMETSMALKINTMQAELDRLRGGARSS